MFEMPQILFVSTIITIIFFVVADQFNAPGYLFICFFLYGIASTLYAFLAALFLNSSLAAWALLALSVSQAHGPASLICQTDAPA
jgi:hypothetical protein